MADKKFKLKKKQVISIIVAALALVVLLIIFIPGSSKNKISDIRFIDENEVLTLTPNSVKTMENERFSLTVDKKNLSIELTDKESGVTYKSAQEYTEGNATWNGFTESAITIEYYSGNSSLSSMVPMTTTGTDISLEYLDDGFNADVTYTDYGFSLQLQVRLTDDGISFYIPGDSITEGTENFIGSIWIYPMFGSTYLGEKEGYMFIPEGAGALIDLHDNNGKYKNAYSKRIYGENVGTDATEVNSYGAPVVTEAETITYPVYGMIYTEDKAGFLGIVTDGDYNASIYAYPNGVITPFNWITARFNVRDVYTKQTAKTSGVPIFESKGDIRSMGLTLKFVDGDEADYSGLAKSYRDYLVDKGDLSKKDENFNIKLDFLGADTEKWLIFNKLIPMTGVSDIKDITEDLYESGAEDFSVNYFGFEKSGDALSKGSTSTGLDGKLGSYKELKNLIASLNEKGISFSLNQELLLANASRVYNTTSDIVKGINQTLVKEPTYQELYENMYFMTPERALTVWNSFMKKNGKLALNGVSVSGVPSELYSYYSGGETYTRADTAAQYLAIFDEMDVEKLSLEKPNAYLYKYMTEYYDMPLATSNYNFISKEVPFLPMVLKGYVPYYGTYANFEADETLYFLKTIEYGAYPAFLVTKESPVELKNSNSSYIYTSEYDVLKDKILEYDGELGSVFEKLSGVSMEKHEYLTDSVVRVTYENGVEIYINYSDNTEDADGVSLAPLSYKILGEE